MPDRYCCPQCFGDPGLTESILPDISTLTGDCSYCGTQAITLVEPLRLREYFEALIEVYEPSPGGHSLTKLLRDDWNLFTHPQMDDAHAKELLSDVLDDGEIVRQSFASSPQYQPESLAHWDKLRDEMMHRNRWFLDESIDFDRLGQLLDHLLANPLHLRSRWHRARISDGDKSFELGDMGAPPQRRAGHGRANPAGIAYLYLGSTPETAAAEIRPSTGDLISIAEFEVPTLRVVDLQTPRASVSPFILTDSEAIGQLRADLPLLERLGEELTRPVLPSGAPFEYIPSQYFCEFIKSRGFDGVIYRSSVSSGTNLALFEPLTARGVSVSSYAVRSVQVHIEADAQ